MRLVLLVRGSEAPDNVRALETIWRDASTPTVAQAADAAVKKHQAKIVPLRQTREDLGYSQAQIARMEEQDEEDTANALRRLASGDVTPLFGTKPGTEPPDPPEDEEPPEDGRGNAA
jgi:hypothetical protein